MEKLSEEELLKRYTDEQLKHRDDEVLVNLTLPFASAVIACLQLSLRHLGNVGPTAEIAKSVIRAMTVQMRAQGLEYSAQAAELGNDPANDRPKPHSGPHLVV